MTDLYGILGIPRDANLAAIRRAFRKKAISCHPDSGGSADAFNDLKMAYDVLSDPVRRRRYDETGDCGDQVIDPRQNKIIETLAIGLDRALLKLNASNRWMHSDIIPTASQILMELRAETERHKQAFEVALDQVKTLKDRFYNSTGENLMEIVVARRELACKDKIAFFSEHLAIVDDALKILRATEITPHLQIVGESLPLGAGPRQANISPLLDINSLIKFK